MDPRTENVTTLLFDWDGTIADSAQLGLTAFQKSFGSLGLEFPQEIYEAVYSPNWYSIYEAMGLPKEKWAMADDLWMQHYGEQAGRGRRGDATRAAAPRIPDGDRKQWKRE